MFMSAKRQENQPALFEFDFDPREYTPQKPFVPWTEYDDAKKVAMLTSPEKGAHVEIDKRWDALIATLGHLARASMLQGLDNAMHTPRREELVRRYEDDLPDLVSNAQVSKNQSEVEARNAFRGAYGYAEMVKHSGDPVQVSEDFVESYDKFQDIYAGAKGNKARNKLRKQIRANQAEGINRRFVQRAARHQLSRDIPE